MKKEKISEIAQVKKQIDDCLKYIKALKTGFNETADNRLINYYIYEKRAAEMKYRYLLSVYEDMMQKT